MFSAGAGQERSTYWATTRIRIPVLHAVHRSREAAGSRIPIDVAKELQIEVR
jgi:hypothetical protein